MKIGFLSCFILLSTFTALAQADFMAMNNNIVERNQALHIHKAYFGQENQNTEKELKRAKRLKIAGLVFTSLGTAGILTTTPFAVIYSSVSKNTHGWGNVAAAVVSMMGYIPSGACLISGIPMTVIGFKKANKLKASTTKEF
ncbi:MAG TPA: hypothetical protein PKY54_03315 [Chitinophagales bacterium]|nr:hypothetical protein [Chitinophagales bacterium]HMY24175.1 hypothetical protein [Chitinophagales bacterium]HMZ34559.1 hypothetical protein [Chitinophagales bacterium]HNA40051.1 hypothetical protein [Chitinophagales bacterium]HNC72638.1 hypothetical protein [Chitinophagales bacterium]